MLLLLLLLLNHLLNAFRCSCSGSIFYFLFYDLYLLAHYCSCAIITLITLQLFLFIFSLLPHCVSYLSYFHSYLYDSALVYVVWLLILTVYNFPYGDFIVIWNVKLIFKFNKWIDVHVTVDMVIEKYKIESSSKKR